MALKGYQHDLWKIAFLLARSSSVQCIQSSKAGVGVQMGVGDDPSDSEWSSLDDDPLAMPPSSSESTSSGKPLRVCVVGAGAAGLCTARHLADNPRHFTFDVYELSASIGGTWVYTDETGLNEYGIPIHSSMYKNLRTNILQEIMGFPDFPFPDAVVNSYPSHDVVLRYLQNYAEKFCLNQYIQFRTEVRVIRPIDGEKQEWAVTVFNHNENKMKTECYDAVAVCNGHYSKPYVPEIRDLEMFEGNVIHSHDYRNPETFAKSAVAVLGVGPSGRDVALDVACFADVVYLCHDKPNISSRLPHNVLQRASIVAATNRCFTLADNSEIQVDTLIFCTGYRYYFPFLHQSCGVQVRGRRVRPLYKHFVHIERPTLAFIGIPYLVVPFPMFHFQTLCFMRSLLDSTIFPSKEEMYEDEENDFISRLDQNMPAKYAHKMGDLQWPYNDFLAELAGVPKLHPAYKELYNINSHQMKNFFMDYKEKNYSAVFKEKLTE